MPKEEPAPVSNPTSSSSTGEGSASAPASATANASANTSNTAARGRGRGASLGRGRGRGARGRGRRVLPRQVARRKTTSAQVPKSLTSTDEGEVGGERGRGRGRGVRGVRGVRGGRGGRGRGRGDGGGVRPTHAPNAVGLGQIAPTRQSGGRASGVASSGVSSRRSSAMSSGGASSSYSIGMNTELSHGSDGGGEVVMVDQDAEDEQARKALEKKESKATAAKNEIVFGEHTEEGYDSDDDMPDDAFDMRNRDIAPYAGMLTDGGLLLPVSLPGLRALPEKFNRFIIEDDACEGGLDDDYDNLENKPGVNGGGGDGDKTEDVVDTGKSKMEKEEAKPLLEVNARAKAEPVEMDVDADNITVDTAALDPDTGTSKMKSKEEGKLTGGAALHADNFPKGSGAHRILRNPHGELALLQLPGLMPLAMSSGDRERATKLRAKAPKLSSVAEAVAASERLRALGIDIRQVGQPGQGHDMGKLRVYKSGRVQLVLHNGGALDIEPGIRPRVNQQVLVVNCKEKTCDELSNAVQTRLVAVPSLHEGGQ